MNPANRLPRFRVDWEPDTGNDITVAYVAYFPRMEGYRVTRAEQLITELLADDPIRNGQLMPEGLDRLSVSPLIAYYEVYPLNRLVKVTTVRYYP